MKTLVKLAKGRRTLPILNAVKVESNFAYSTDMDMVIQETIEPMTDGLYHSEGFDSGLKIKFDQAIDNFPILIPGKKLLGNVTMPIDDLEFVSRFMSTEATRFYLNGICFNGNDMVSTDGHRLGKITYETPFPISGDSYIVPANAIKYILLLSKENKQKEVNIEFFDNRFVANIGKSTLYSKLIDGNFPDYNRVIPTEHQHKTTFNPADFKAKEKEIRSLAKINGNKYIVVGLNSGQAHTKFSDIDNISFPIATSLPEETGFNLDYLLSMEPGDLYWNDPHSPIKIVSGNRLNVLMPTRI